MFKVIRDETTGKIKTLQVQDVVFSYAYLVSPRGEKDFNPGTYGTELIISDDDTVKAIKEYLNQVIEEAKSTTWDNKIPKNLNLPIRQGNEENEYEKGAIILKTSTKNQPKLFIRPEGETRAREVEEEELDEIYSGMVGEAIVKFSAYSYNGIKGIKAYLNAVCKTGDGESFESSISYEDAFSEASDFDIEAKPSKKATKKKKVEEENEEGVDLDSIINSNGSKKGTTKKSTTSKGTTKKSTKRVVEDDEDEEDEITIDDLIK